MKAFLNFSDDSLYYGQTSLADPKKKHGKGIHVNKFGYIYECWWDNDKQVGKGRMINNNK